MCLGRAIFQAGDIPRLGRLADGGAEAGRVVLEVSTVYTVEDSRHNVIGGLGDWRVRPCGGVRDD